MIRAKKISKILCVILIGVGFLRSFLFVASLIAGQKISWRTLDSLVASPLPAVFSEDYFFTKLSLRLTLQSGAIVELPFDAKISAAFRGSSGRSRILYLFLGRPHLFPQAQWQRVVDYYFCKTSVMKKALHLTENVAAIHLSFQEPVPRGIAPREFDHRCE